MTEEKSEQEIVQAVQERAAQLLGSKEREPLEPHFVKDCLDSNERGDGCLFATLFKDKYLLNNTPKDGEWYRWFGHVWEIDKKSRAFADVEQCALEYLRQAIARTAKGSF